MALNDKGTIITLPRTDNMSHASGKSSPKRKLLDCYVQCSLFWSRAKYRSSIATRNGKYKSQIVQWNIGRTLCVCVYVYVCVRYSTVKKEKRRDELQQQTAQKDLCTMTHTFGLLLWVHIAEHKNEHLCSSNSGPRKQIPGYAWYPPVKAFFVVSPQKTLVTIVVPLSDFSNLVAAMGQRDANLNLE